MKKTMVICGIILVLSGCAFIQDRKADWAACKADPVCSSNAEKWKETGQTVGELAGSVTPGAAMPGRLVGGYLFEGLALLIGGYGLRKKKQAIPTVPKVAMVN